MLNKQPWLLHPSNFISLPEVLTYSELLTSELLQDNSNIKGIYFLARLESESPYVLLTDGDIRRALSTGRNINDPLKLFASTDQIWIRYADIVELSASSLVVYLTEISQKRGLAEIPRYFPVTDHERLVYVLDTIELRNASFSQRAIGTKSIAIVGLGYVGITLATHVAQSGHLVVGYDIDSSLIDSLSQNQFHVIEPLLAELAAEACSRGTLKYRHIDSMVSHDAYIVCVGSALINYQLDSSQIFSAVTKVLEVLRPYQHIYLRSTVPVGFTRELASFINDFLCPPRHVSPVYISFVPERTVEGNALSELSTLPQPIGSINAEAKQDALSFWSSLSSSIIECSSLEEAELIKLISNSYRDLSFAFANLVSLYCERYSINAHQLIAKSNEGYIRNSIPKPSPGVGGYCLTKDPILFEHSFQSISLPRLLSIGREINLAASSVPHKAFMNWKHLTGIQKPKILIIGLAFKGSPENTDIRSTPTETLFDKLESASEDLDIYDYALSRINTGIQLGKYAPYMLTGPSPDIENNRYDCVLVMNNHALNTTLDLSSYVSATRPFLLFDGWHQFAHLSTVTQPYFYYTTMGRILEDH